MPFLLPPPTRGKNLSQKTLRQILVGMLLTVFVGYCTLMFFLIRQHHIQQQSVLDGRSTNGNSNSWGPTGHSMATAKDILRDHMQYIADQRRKELFTPEIGVQHNKDAAHEGSRTTRKAKKVVEGPLGQGGVTTFERFENLPKKSKHKDEGDADRHGAKLVERPDSLKQDGQ